ncbi:MAG: ATP-binding protein [Gemmatimonadota bacterium]
MRPVRLPLRSTMAAAAALLALATVVSARLLPGLLVVPAAALLGWWFGSRLKGELALLRRRAVARARGRTGPPLASPFPEVGAAGAAVDRLADEQARELAALRGERAELAAQLEAVSEGILQVDGQGRVVHANPAAYRLLRLPADVRGEPLAALVRSAEVRGVLARVAAGESDPFTEATLEARRLLVTGRPLPAVREGAPGAVLGVVDLTDLRRLESVRRDFVANVSHELKTPLTSIRGYAETLRTDADLPADTRAQFLDVIQHNADRLQRIVEELLDLSRLESGVWQPDARPVRPAAVAEDAWSDCRAAAERKGVRFRVEGGEVAALGDPDALRQVFTNLLDNAVRATPEGGAIEVRAYHEAPWVVVAVADTGVGIPGDALGRVFERFYRVDPARSRAAGGTGLGLAIVKHLVEGMGGQVSATSQLGKGTTVRVSLREAPPA